MPRHGAHSASKTRVNALLSTSPARTYLPIESGSELTGCSLTVKVAHISGSSGARQRAERASTMLQPAAGESIMASSLPFFQDTAFDSDMTRIMGEAFDHACASLHDIGQPDLVREVIARRIIEVAQTGERDPIRLSARALVAMGINDRR